MKSLRVMALAAAGLAFVSMSSFQVMASEASSAHARPTMWPNLKLLIQKV
jgi:hypothetical protein